MYVYCVYPAMSKNSENLSDLNKKDRNKHYSSPFINVVKGVFFVVRVTLVPVSYLSSPSAVHSYRVPGKFICRLKSLFVGWKVYSSNTNKAKIYSYCIFVQEMYWLQDKDNNVCNNNRQNPILVNFFICVRVVLCHFQQYLSYIVHVSFIGGRKTGVPWENHRPATSHWQTLSHNVVSSMPCHERDSNSQR
jgi:hypothetical protein